LAPSSIQYCMDDDAGLSAGRCHRRVEYEGETMAPPTRTPRSEWIRQGLRALAAGGPDAVRIESLAKELGVSRGGFYWHFADRGALLAAMLDTWERATTQEVADQLDSGGGDASAKLRRLFALTSPNVVKADLAIRDWARRDHAVAARLRRVDNRRMGHLRALFAGLSTDPAEIEARCLLTFSLLIGNHYITADHGSYSRTDVLEMALRQLAARGVPDARLGQGQRAGPR
jgi:AcrR family transcriptional regulator